MKTGFIRFIKKANMLYTSRVCREMCGRSAIFLTEPLIFVTKPYSIMRKILYPLLCVFALSSCRETPPKPPVVEVEDVAVDDIEMYGEYAGLIKAY